MLLNHETHEGPEKFFLQTVWGKRARKIFVSSFVYFVYFVVNTENETRIIWRFV
jgi:hypothetical protein